ncbi:hypothetical protein [Williamsia sp.]|uniref:hypothetical protein n=1 Tax=Williamsia sp. TaxID=1872085 RepID=UPI002F945DFC
MTNDVEKRWNDPRAFHTAGRYVGGVVVLAGLWLVLYLLIDPSSILWGMGVTAILLGGGIGAFVQAYRVYTRGGTWPVWQGAGWILFALMLATMGLVAV